MRPATSHRARGLTQEVSWPQLVQRGDGQVGLVIRVQQGARMIADLAPHADRAEAEGARADEVLARVVSHVDRLRRLHTELLERCAVGHWAGFPGVESEVVRHDDTGDPAVESERAQLA